VDTVIFDMMGVLYDGGHFVSEELFQKVSDALTVNELRHRYRRYAVGKITREQFWQGLFDDWHEQEQRMLAELQPKPGLDLVRELKGRYFLALITELPTDWAETLLKRAKLDTLFDTTIISGREGCTKPHSKIFQRLVDRLPKTGRRLYFDDKMENLATASTFGIATAWVRNPGRRPDTDFTPNHVVANLHEAVVVVRRALG